MKSTVAIIGSHIKTRELFDFDRTDCDIWVFNEALSQKWARRADAVFQLHREEIWKNPANRNDPGHANWLQTQTDVTVYMQKAFLGVPRAVEYPLDEVLALLPAFAKKYITSSISYAVALAIVQGYETIEIYGVELEMDTEYRYQRDCFTFWVGYALGMGIEVKYTGGIFGGMPLYGYEGEVSIDMSMFENRIAELTPVVDKQAALYNDYREKANAALQNFVDTGKDGELVSQTIKAQIKAGWDFGMMDGAKQENQRYIERAKTMTGAAGGFLFSRTEFEQSAQACFKKKDELITESNTLAGLTQAAFEQLNTPNGMKRQKRVSKYAQVVSEYIRKSILAGAYYGAYRENVEYLSKLDALIKAAGGTKSEAVLLEAAKG